jgi:DTW domain-containing protein YfiP
MGGSPAATAAVTAALAAAAAGCVCVAGGVALLEPEREPEPEPEPKPVCQQQPQPSATAAVARKQARNAEAHRQHPTALPRRRTTRDVQQSLSAEERFFVVGEEALARRAAEVVALGRCPDCWHNTGQQSGGNRCICAQLPALTLSIDVRVVVYMHYLEWMNSGNSGKLLLKCLQQQPTPHSSTCSASAELFLYGRRDDDERLRALVAADPEHTALLFPSPDATTLEEFVASAAAATAAAAAAADAEGGGGDGGGGDGDGERRQQLTLVVLDATYRKAKNMAKHFRRRIDGTGRVRYAHHTTATHTAVQGISRPATRSIACWLAGVHSPGRAACMVHYHY